jgi:PKD repeat protein
VARITSSCVAGSPNKIRWSGVSSSNETSYRWIIDGNTSTASSVTVTYPVDTTHVAQLTVKGPGGSDTTLASRSTPCP